MSIDNDKDSRCAEDSGSEARRRFILKGVLAGTVLFTGSAAQAQEQIRPQPTQVIRRRTKRKVSRRANARIRLRGTRTRLRAKDPKLRGLELLIGSILIDPDLTDRLFREPRKVAEAVNIQLTDEEVRRIKSLPRESRSKIEKWSGEFQASFVESLREYKTDIKYLGQQELESLHHDLLDTQLATWRYHWTPSHEQLGLSLMMPLTVLHSRPTARRSTCTGV